MKKFKNLNETPIKTTITTTRTTTATTGTTISNILKWILVYWQKNATLPANEKIIKNLEQSQKQGLHLQIQIASMRHKNYEAS